MFIKLYIKVLNLYFYCYKQHYKKPKKYKHKTKNKKARAIQKKTKTKNLIETIKYYHATVYIIIFMFTAVTM